MLDWQRLHPRASVEWHLGFIPDWLDETDPRPAAAQLNERYAHGGGWRPFNGFTMNPDLSLQYPEDPPTLPLFKAQMRAETIVVYEHAWVAIIQADKSFEVCRMD